MTFAFCHCNLEYKWFIFNLCQFGYVKDSVMSIFLFHCWGDVTAVVIVI